MGYKDYLPKFQSGGIMDAANPFWNKAYQYVPRNYVGLDVDSRLALITKQPETPKLPDLSKFKEKLDKDVLYAEKSAIFNRFNNLERKIREELKENPYALTNNYEIINSLNELITMYNSPELQSQIDKKKVMEKQQDKAREKGQSQSFVFDPQTNEYIPTTFSELSESFMNSQGNKNNILSIIYGDLNSNGLFNNISFGNVGKGTEKDFTGATERVYTHIKTNSNKKGSSGENLQFLNSFGKIVNPSEAEGYISTISGKTEGWRNNLENLAELTNFLAQRNGNFSDIIGEDAQEGFNQLVTKTLNEGNAYNQFSNILGIQKEISEQVKEIAKKEGKPIPKTTYDDISGDMDFIKKDENLLQALSQVSSQQLLYDLKVLQSNKGENAKKLTLSKNPVLSYLFSQGEQGEKKLASLVKLLDITKKNTQDAIILNNTKFNTIINKTVNYEKEEMTRHSLSGKGYGGANEEKQKDVGSEYIAALHGLQDANKAKEIEISLEDAKSNLLAINPNLSEEQAQNIIYTDAALNDYVKNSTNPKVASIVADLIRAQNRGDKEEEKRLSNIIYNSAEEQGINKKLVYNSLVNGAKQKVAEKIKEYKNDPKKAQGAVIVKEQYVNPSTQQDANAAKIRAGYNNDELINGNSLYSIPIIIDGYTVPKEALGYIDVKNGGGEARVLQIDLPSYSSRGMNSTTVNREIYIDPKIFDDKNEKVKKFLNEIFKTDDESDLKSNNKVKEVNIKNKNEERRLYRVFGATKQTRDAVMINYNSKRLTESTIPEGRVQGSDIYGDNIDYNPNISKYNKINEQLNKIIIPTSE